MALFLGVLLVIAVSARLSGGRLLRLADMRFRHTWVLLSAFAVQFAIFKVFSHHNHAVQPVLYLFSYGMGAAFLWLNRKVPGLWLIGVGALCNGLAIAANGGVMPGSAAAFAAAHLTAAPSEFVNSRALLDPRLLFLGDVFAVPGWLPIHNVFSVGDLCIIVGAFIGIHRVTGSRLLPSGTGQFSGLVGERNFLRLWGAQAISNQGDWVYTLGVVASLARRGLGAEVLATLVVMQAAPRALASAFGGPLVDRFNRRRIMVVADVVRAAAVGSLLLAPSPSLHHLYAVGATLGLFAALFQPSLQASIPNVVPPNRLVAANALVSATFQLAIMIGPLLGALLVSHLGLTAAFGVNAVSFLVSAALVAGVKLPAQPPRTADGPSPRQALVEGVRFALLTPVVRGILLVTGLIMFAAAIRNPLEPLFVLRVLHAEPSALGLPPAVWGLGMLLGSTAAPAAARRWSCERMLTFSVLLVGLAVLCASRSMMLSSLLGLWLMAGSGNAVGTIAYQSLLQYRTPDRLRGRIVAASETVLDVAYLAGVTLAGWLGVHAGLRVALAVAGVCFVLAAVAARLVLGKGVRAAADEPAFAAVSAAVSPPAAAPAPAAPVFGAPPKAGGRLAMGPEDGEEVAALRAELFSALAREQALLDEIARLSAPSAGVERELVASLGQATAEVLEAAQAAAKGIVERAQQQAAQVERHGHRRPVNAEARAAFDKLREAIDGPQPEPIATVRRVRVPVRVPETTSS
ncbi:MAG TPA: MFS transporter [Acidimicrobiales bacterium]|nr:MFS transporter [Acidimicrobiales bacterium]